MKPSAVFGFSKNLLVVLMIVLPASQAVAQATADSTSEKRANSLRKGAWALSFQVATPISLSDISISGLQGTVFGKYHLSDNSAVRAGVSYTYSLTSYEGNSFTSDTTPSEYRSGKSSVGSYFITGQYISYPKLQSSDVNFYYGGGLSTQITTPSKYYSETTEESTSSWNVGLLGILGIEWFATKQLSFFAEYNFSLVYLRTHNRLVNTGYPQESYENQNWSIQVNAKKLALGISVYFY